MEVRFIGTSKQITGNKEMGWGMNASNMYTSKLDKYIILDSVFKLDLKKSEDGEYVVVKTIQCFRMLLTFFRLVRCLKHDLSY